MFRALKICLLVLAVCAIGHAQVFGVQAGYVCADNGAVKELAEEHCHREVSSSDFTPCDVKTPHDSNGKETSHHEALVTELQSSNSQSSVPVAPPLYVPVMLALLPHLEWLMPFSAQEARMVSERHWLDTGGPPATTSVQVATCMVLLV